MNGHLELVKWLIRESGQVVDITENAHALIRLVAQEGQLNVLKWLVEDSGLPVCLTAFQNAPLEQSARNGHLDTFQYLLANIPATSISFGEAFQILEMAVFFGRPHIIESIFFESHFQEKQRLLSKVLTKLTDPRYTTNWNFDQLKCFVRTYLDCDVLGCQSKQQVATKIRSLTTLQPFIRQLVDLQGLPELRRRLDQLNVAASAKIRVPYYISQACRLLARSGVADSLADFDKLRQQPMTVPRTARHRL